MGSEQGRFGALLLKIDTENRTYHFWVPQKLRIVQASFDIEGPRSKIHEDENWVDLAFDTKENVTSWFASAQPSYYQCSSKAIKVSNVLAAIPPFGFVRDLGPGRENEQCHGHAFAPTFGWMFPVVPQITTELARLRGKFIAADLHCVLTEDKFALLYRMKKAIWFITSYRVVDPNTRCDGPLRDLPWDNPPQAAPLPRSMAGLTPPQVPSQAPPPLPRSMAEEAPPLLRKVTQVSPRAPSSVASALGRSGPLRAVPPRTVADSAPLQAAPPLLQRMTETAPSLLRSAAGSASPQAAPPLLQSMTQAAPSPLRSVAGSARATSSSASSSSLLLLFEAWLDQRHFKQRLLFFRA
ncbi:hypothetical protein L596_012786 [Steinernema carpocapsae]|uniref:Uncharacterized protein n=1 Tax=Steinernema carpocapsae TaxID=34508 RepID=A0A4U5NYG1_STECR|nr:hypothetical protein L596_012786 [Steinernema carpocapsae]